MKLLLVIFALVILTIICGSIYMLYYIVNLKTVQTQPTPQPSPSPTPQPTPTPQPSPSPTPQPTPQPIPSPTPTPQPSPTPQPTPTPSPTPSPQPQPSPTPTPPSPTPQPTSGFVLDPNTKITQKVYNPNDLSDFTDIPIYSSNGNALNGFMLNMTDNYGVYRYKNVSSPELNDARNTKTTREVFFNERKNENLALLDVKCDDNQVLNEFNVEKNMILNTLPVLKYSYQCKTVNSPLKCRSVSTPWVQNTESNCSNLSEMVISCEPDEALSQFKLEDDYLLKRIRYNYTCCKINK